MKTRLLLLFTVLYFTCSSQTWMGSWRDTSNQSCTVQHSYLMSDIIPFTLQSEVKFGEESNVILFGQTLDWEVRWTSLDQQVEEDSTITLEELPIKMKFAFIDGKYGSFMVINYSAPFKALTREYTLPVTEIISGEWDKIVFLIGSDVEKPEGAIIINITKNTFAITYQNYYLIFDKVRFNYSGKPFKS